MQIITINISREKVYSEVAKATDYTGTKLEGRTDDEDVRERILMTDEDLRSMSVAWDDCVSSVNEELKEMLSAYASNEEGYTATLEVSAAFDTVLCGSVESCIRGFFISWMTGQWFVYSNKGESEGRMAQAVEYMGAAVRMLYSRRRPKRPEK